MKVITGDETGLLKLVDMKRGSYDTSGEQLRQNGIKALTWLADGSSKVTTNVFSALRANGNLEFWHHNLESDSLTGLHTLCLQTDLVDPVGVLSIHGGQLSSARLLAFSSNGACKVASYDPTGGSSSSSSSSSKKAKDKSDAQSIKPQRDPSMTRADIVAEYDCTDVSTNMPSCSIIKEFTCASGDPAHGIGSTACPFTTGIGMVNGFALAGKENDLKIYDLSSSSSEPVCVWKGKNLPNDKLSLRIPIWITDAKLRFPGEGNIDMSGNTNGAHIVTCTAHRQIRLYDTKAKRQPVTNIENCSEYRLSSIQSSVDGNSVYVGDATGSLFQYDLRTGKRVGVLKGSIGSIRSLQLERTGSHVVAVGLDRHAVIYHTNNHNGKGNDHAKVYLTNRLTCALIADDDKDKKVVYPKNEKKKSFRVRDDDDDEEEEEEARADSEDIDSGDENSDMLEQFSDSEEEDEDEDEDEEEEKEEAAVLQVPTKDKKRKSTSVTASTSASGKSHVSLKEKRGKR